MRMDIVIPVKTNLVQLAIDKTIPSVLSKLTYKQVFIVTKKQNFQYFYSAFQDSISLMDEDDIVDGLTIEKVRKYFESKNVDQKRAGWYFQQFIKLGISQSKEISDLYLVWDADNVVLKPISFISNENKVLHDISSEYHKPYFELIEKLIGIKKQVDYSFISEHLVFDKNIVLNLLNQISNRIGFDWWIEILEKIEYDHLSNSGFSEYELYGNFVTKYHPDYFMIRQLNKTRSGKRLLGMKPNSFSLFIFSHIYDYMSFETWHKKIRPLPLRYITIMKTLFVTMCKNALKRILQ